MKIKFEKTESSMRTLPIEGLALRELFRLGNGKDAEVQIVAADGRRFSFPMGEHLRIAVNGAVLTEVQALDDVNLRVRYTAEHLVLKRARVEYPGSLKEWKEDLASFRREESLLWTIPLADLELVGAQGPA